MSRVAGLKAAVTIAGLIVFASSSVLAADIYRCVQAGTIIFSDLPCDENAERYELQAALSIIETPPGLDAIAEQNRQIVEQRQQRRERTRAAAQARLREQRAAQRRQTEYPPMVYQPVVLYRANPPHDDRDDEPARPIDPPQDRPVSARSRILSNRSTDTQRDILRPGRERP